MSDKKPASFPQVLKLKTPEEFKHVYDRKRSASDGVLLIYVCENELAHPRLGVSVSKKVGNAVVRNRYKRLFREAFRLLQHDLPPSVDLVVIPRSSDDEPSFEAIKESMLELTRQAAAKLRPAPS